MGRAPCCEKNGVKKGPWTPEEDKLLIEYMHKNGCGNWRTVPNNAGLQRCGKSCRLRWTNYLRPDIKRGRFSFHEEEAIIQLHTILGNKWSAIAARLPGRTDNEIKNYWNTHIIKRLVRMGIDPVTHRFRPDLLVASITNSSNPTSSPQSTLSRLLRMQASTNYPEIMRLASSPIQNHQIHDAQVQAQQLVQMQTPFQDFTIPPNCLDHHQLMHYGGVESFPQNLSGFGSELLAENYGLAAATCGYYGSGQPVVDPGSSMDSCTFQSDSSSGFGLEQSVLSYISIPLSSPTTLQF